MKAEFLILFFCSFYAAKSEENVSREGKNIDLFLERRKPTPKPFEKEEEKTSRDGNTAAELCMTQSRNLYLLLQLGCGETRNRICITTEGIMTGKMALFTKKIVPFWPEIGSSNLFKFGFLHKKFGYFCSKSGQYFLKVRLLSRYFA